MRDTTTDLASYLLESVSYRLIVDVFYGDERTYPNLPVTDWELVWDIETATKSEGTLTVQYQGDRGDSLTPKEFLDTLAPYGQQVNVLIEVSFGEIFTETVLLGRFRINAAPQSVEDWFGFEGRPYVLGSTIQVAVGDLLTMLDSWAFRGPSVPKYTTSTWDELQSITTLPVAPTLTDRPTPANFVYVPGPGGRLTGMQQLMSYLGGIAVTNEYGELTAVPYAAGGSVNTLTMGTRGTIVSVESELDSSTLFNEVIGEYQDDDGTPIYAWAVIDSGPLATTGEYRSRTAPTDHDDTVTSLTAAQARVRKVLTQYLHAQTVRYTLQVALDPRTQVGDVVDVEGPRTRRADRSLSDPAWTLTAARVVSIRMGSGNPGLMTVTLDVGAALKASIRVGP